MINIPRTRNDDFGNLIQPNAQWFAKADAETKKAINEKADHNVSRPLYAHEEVKKALEMLFYFKCAYCESPINRIEWDVEHFRPKGRVQERKNHPGYYWLPYEWTNLFPSCTFCNQFRKAKPRWFSEEPQFAGGKADHFPVEPESSRAMSHTSCLNKEKRRLVDPCVDNPEKMFKYDTDGQIFAVSNRNKKKAQASIDIFNLRETRLRDKRKERISEMIGFLKLKIDLTDKGMMDEAACIEKIVKKNYLREKKEYAGICRYVFDNPLEFGVDL